MLHERKSPRLRNWDYRSNGYYFVTICTKNRECFFGKIANGKMELSAMGEIAKQCWIQIPIHFRYIALDEFIVMPDHIHGIIVIDGSFIRRDEAMPRPYGFSYISPKSNSLSSIIGSFKSIVSKRCHQNGFDCFAWQSRFHDHIIRDKRSLFAIREYIKNNPANWENDMYNH